MRRWVGALILVAMTSASLAETYIGRVVGISDGDTVTVLDQTNSEHRVRLAGIDAPEKRQPFGQVSKKNLSDLIATRLVTVETKKRDRYQREIGKISYQGRDINLEQVKSGLAWHYKQYQNEQSPNDRTAYAEAELSAKSMKRGLWKDSEPVAPWEFRHKR